jgi:hypothetical protein
MQAMMEKRPFVMQPPSPPPLPMMRLLLLLVSRFQSFLLLQCIQSTTERQRSLTMLHNTCSAAQGGPYGGKQ